MKAVWYERNGPAPEVLVYGDMPTPVAGPGEVRVRLEASGVNPADVGRRGGSYRAMEYPRVIPNSDGAGIVDQIGDGVTRLKIGQRVWLFNGQRNGRAFGTAAEYITLAEHLVTPLPDDLSFAAGATLGIPGMTAWCCLYCDGPIAGKTVLVTGGAGAVGHYAVQLAKWGGAQVIATVSSAAKAEQARLAGADLVINYRTDDVIAKVMAFTGQRGVDRVVDVDFGGNIETTLKLMGMNSTIAVYATNGNRTPLVPMRDLMEKCISVRALVLFALPPPLLAAAQADISKWLAAGTRLHNVAGQFALSDTALAHLAVEKGDKMGTVIVDCARQTEHRIDNNKTGKRRMHWNVGKVKITKVVEMETVGSTRFILPLATNEEIQKLPWLIPHFATEEGRLKMSIHSLLVETPTRRIIVDTGLGNDKEGRNVPTWNNRKDPFLDTLTAAGFAPDSIDTVLCTHLHVDHVGWNTSLVGGKWVPTFTNARYVFGKTEFEHWRDHSHEPAHIAVFADSVQPIADAGKADLVASDAKLTDEITLIPTPGHSPGHMSIHIRSDGQEALLTGDVAHHPCQMAHLGWSSTADSDQRQSAATRRELFSRFADTPTLVIGGHFNAGHIKREGDAFKFIALG